MATYTSNYGWTKPSGSDNVDISVLNDNLDDQDSVIHDAFLNMAPVFSEQATYAVGDKVLYETTTYKCHTAVTTAGSWTGSTNWQVYKLSEGGSGGGGTSNYNQLTNKPQINSVELSGNKTSAQLGLMASDGVVANPTGQTTGTLTALEVGGTKYAVGGGSGTSDYTDLTNKPSINGVELSGNKTTADLDISYNDLDDLPTIPAAQVNSDWNASSGVAEILNKPTIPTSASDISYGSGSVEDALDEVTTTTSLVLSNSTYLYENGVIRKKNGVVCVTFNGFKGLTNNVTTDILNLIPSNMRPSYTISVIAFSPGAAGGEMYRVKINNTGTVSVYPYTGISLQNNLIVTLTYVS